MKAWIICALFIYAVICNFAVYIYSGYLDGQIRKLRQEAAMRWITRNRNRQIPERPYFGWRKAA